MKRWYVAQVYAGYEELVKKDLDRRIAELKEDLFGQVLLPSAKLKSFFVSEEEQIDERLFPGYILIEMEKNPESLAVVAATPKILKFLGGKDPVALSRKEVERVLSQVKGEVVISKGPREEFSEGAEVDIKDGPFSGFVGIVDRVDEENEKLSVMVSIFGRLTPVELTFDQVKK
jgi:transcriptional antiterminator NusG